jgi:hypothetical protein
MAREELIANSLGAEKRFLDSMQMNYEKSHDGVGYDSLSP